MVTWTAGVSWPAGCSDVFQPPLEGYCEPVERAGERKTTLHTVRATEGILTRLDCWTELLVPGWGRSGWGWSEAAVGVAMTCCPVSWSEALSLRRLMGAGGSNTVQCSMWYTQHTAGSQYYCGSLSFSSITSFSGSGSEVGTPSLVFFW